ncbi:hypothetical protein C3941_07715 [Kaistia algarum]|nr:hypothetical protein C3941_07715 [Kaistia algarum]
MRGHPITRRHSPCETTQVSGQRQATAKPDPILWPEAARDTGEGTFGPTPVALAMKTASNKKGRLKAPFRFRIDLSAEAN